MELKSRQSDLTETSKRALATNRGQSETLKSTYETLESDYKAKCHTVNAEQTRFLRMIKTKLPAIRVSNDESQSTLARPRSFLTPPISPQVERKTPLLPCLSERSHQRVARRRSRSFSDLSEAVRARDDLLQARMTRQKSLEHHQGTKTEDNTEQQRFIGNRPRSCSNIEQPFIFAKGDGQEKLPDNANNKLFLKETIGSPRKVSSPAKLSPSPVSVDRTLESRKLTSKKPLGQQLEDVKDLRYLRTGRYSSETTVTEHITDIKNL